jgi:DNA polymerase-3 subunit alpha
VSSVVAGQEPPVILVTSLERVTPEFVDSIKTVLLSHPGKTPVHLRLRSTAGRETLLALSNVRVANDVPFRSEIKVMLGAGGIE